MTPPCCKNCQQLTREGRCLSQGTDCSKWRAWFHREWTAIQTAAAVIKAPPEETRKETPTIIEKRRTVCLPK